MVVPLLRWEKVNEVDESLVKLIKKNRSYKHIGYEVKQ